MKMLSQLSLVIFLPLYIAQAESPQAVEARREIAALFSQYGIQAAEKTILHGFSSMPFEEMTALVKGEFERTLLTTEPPPGFAERTASLENAEYADVAMTAYNEAFLSIVASRVSEESRSRQPPVTSNQQHSKNVEGVPKEGETPPLVLLLFGAFVAGALCGVPPFMVALRKGRRGLAFCSWICCVAAGLIWGVILAIPVAFLLLVIVFALPEVKSLPPSNGTPSKSSGSSSSIGDRQSDRF